MCIFPIHAFTIVCLSMIGNKFKILISSDKIKTPNSGLGRVALDFDAAMIDASQFDFELSFLLANKPVNGFLANQRAEILTFWKRYFPFYLKKYDLFHASYQGPSYKIKGAKKTILTIHDLNFLFTKNEIKQKKYLKRIQSNVNDADAIVFISNFTYQTCLKHLQFPVNKIIKIIYNGVQLPKCEPVKPYWIPQEPYFFAIGQFLEKKNFHVLMPFMTKLEGHSIIIAGDNNTGYGKKVKDISIDLGIKERVILSGPITEAEKLYLYQNCKAFFVPSIAEGFGLPVIEAMSAGKPVFCSNQTSLTEIGNKHAYYWKSFEPEAMLEVYNNGMNKFTEQARVEAIMYSQQFTWQQNVKEYIELYKLLLEQ